MLFALWGGHAQAEELVALDFAPIEPAKAALGQLLFYDPILSGNRNISCGTCHNHDYASADGVALGIGEGGAGLGPARSSGEGASRIKARIARNAPGLFNLGARQIKSLFHDGRVQRSDLHATGFDTPARGRLPAGLEGDLLAVQALFPMVSAREMAGDRGENDVADALLLGRQAAWSILADRVQSIPAYARAFEAGFGDIDAPRDITIAHIADAIGAFIDAEWRSLDAPYDRGELSPEAEQGKRLFFWGSWVWSLPFWCAFFGSEILRAWAASVWAGADAGL